MSTESAVFVWIALNQGGTTEELSLVPAYCRAEGIFISKSHFKIAITSFRGWPDQILIPGGVLGATLGNNERSMNRRRTGNEADRCTGYGKGIGT